MPGHLYRLFGMASNGSAGIPMADPIELGHGELGLVGVGRDNVGPSDPCCRSRTPTNPLVRLTCSWALWPTSRERRGTRLAEVDGNRTRRSQ
jgi:hypothetical protein